MVIKQDFLYTPTGKMRKLHIRLPEEYADTDERYPVMYFFDGHNLFSDADATYGKSWGLTPFLEQWPKEMIIVGIECGHEGQERLREYLPYEATGDLFGSMDGIGEQTVQWIVEEVKPMIDQTYRTWPFRECTGIAGSSMGGLMAVYAVVHWNRWFSKAACISSAIMICMDPLMEDLKAYPVDPDTRVYLSWGSREARGAANPNEEDCSSETWRCNSRVAEKLEQCGAAVSLHCQVGGGHCEADWEKLVPGFMDFLWMA